MLKIFSDAEELAREAAKFIAAVGIGCANTQGSFDLVLAGGRTPLAAYQHLASEFGHNARLWKCASIWWGDERCVAAEHHDSNYYWARFSLLLPLGITRERTRRIEGEARDPARAAADYAKAFPARPDLLILGIGEDGHTAALFPNSAALGEKEARFVCVDDAPKPPPRRITATPPTLLSARRTLVLASGRSKANAVERALAVEGSVAETPARLAREALWMVDLDAAGKIT